MTRIGLLGATGHIAKGLIFTLSQSADITLVLYARRPQAVGAFCQSLTAPQQKRIQIEDIRQFGRDGLDAVINAIGAGDPAHVKSLGPQIFHATEMWDNAVLDYISRHKDTRYLFLSSGAVYGTEAIEPATANSTFSVNPNAIDSSHSYTLAKLNAEAKHRAHSDANICDIRVFAYFSRFIDLGGTFFLAELARSLMNGEVFVTSPEDMIRDYADAEHLTALVRCCLEPPRLNAAVDLYTKAPVRKFELLERFAVDFGVKYRISSDRTNLNATGLKRSYYSSLKTAAKFGYQPFHSAEDIVASEMAVLLSSAKLS